MDISNAQRVRVLVEALPYIQKYSNKTVVIKYGGNAMINEDLKDAVMGDVALLSQIGIKVVLVHGGGPEITDMLGKIGKESKFVNGLRVTDKETADIVQMVLAGKVNKSLVSHLQGKGCKAVGICGADGHLIKSVMKDENLGYVGEITEINTDVISDLLSMGYVPVVSTTGVDDYGNVYNINADTAAAKIAGELCAESMISMTDIDGILRDKNDPSTLIPKIYVSEISELVNEGIIKGGMIPKVDCCREAIRRGVKKVFIIDGRVPHSLLIEILTDEGIGTMFVQS